MFQLGIPGCRLRIPTYLYSICWKPSTSHLIPNMWVWLQSLNVLRSLLKLKACPKYSKMYRRLIFPKILVHSVDIYGRMAAAAKKKSRPRSKCHYEQKLGLKVANFSHENDSAAYVSMQNHEEQCGTTPNHAKSRRTTQKHPKPRQTTPNQTTPHITSENRYWEYNKTF